MFYYYIGFLYNKISDSIIPSFLVSDVSDHERFAQFAHQKGVTMSESFRLLTKNERIAHFFAKNERFAQKTDE